MSDPETLERAAQALRDSAPEVSAEDRAQLAAARRRAVAELDGHQPRSWRWFAPGAAALAGVALVVTVSLPSQEIPLPIGEGFEAAQDMEMLEDLEFVAWMIEQDAV